MADEILTPAKIYAQTGNLPTGVYVAGDMTEAVNAALRRLGKDHPRPLYGKITGDGTSVYDLSAANMTGWDEDESVVQEISYPYTVADENILATTEWYLVDDPDNGLSLVLASASPAATETIRVKFTGAWTEATVPSGWISAVAKLAAANYLVILAARYAQKGESTMTADTFNGQAASDAFIRLANKLESEYRDTVGIPESSGGADGGVAAAVSWGQVDPGGHDGLGVVIPYGDEV